MKVLKILSDNYSFLFLKHNFEIIKGKFYGNNSGFVIASNNIINIKIVCERNEDIYTEVSSCQKTDEWFELEIIKYYLLPQKVFAFMPFNEQVDYLSTNVLSIIQLFSENINLHINELIKIRKMRADLSFNI
jgi:hypothetical protein